MQGRELFERKIKYQMRWIFFQRKWRRFFRENVESYVDQRGLRMAVYANDLIGSEIYLNGMYAKEEIEDMFALMEWLGVDTASAIVLDIGANIGNHTIQFAKKFAHVHAFEPNPYTFRLLKFNTETLKNVSIYPVGLSDEQGELELIENITNYGASSAAGRNSDECSSFESMCEVGGGICIKINKLDEINIEFDKVKFIKIDVEGMELNVLKGAQKLLRESRPIIAFEQWASEFISPNQETPTIRFLRNLDYEICVINDDVQKNWKKAWLIRKLTNIYELFFGRTITRSLIIPKIISKKNYPVLVAIPRELIIEQHE